MSWWEDAVGYEVYIRSFADGDDDGIGDFKGLTSRLGHLADLGVDVVWVTPFYPSPQADFGYDVADHYSVDPVYGSLGDFDRFVAVAHDLQMRVVIDLVPNHTSSHHPWFSSAVEEGPGSEHWDKYVWRDPGPDGGPPNNWVSVFGGPAWTLVPRWEKYYMHLFLADQPDLNWSNQEVAIEFRQILRHWVERGVDGFRIDVAHSLLESPGFEDNPPIEGLEGDPEDFADFDHLHDLDQESTPDIYRDWKQIVGEDVLLLGEVYLTEPEKVQKYVVEGALDLSFFFGLNRIPWDPEDFESRLRRAVEAVPEGWAWVQGSHDEHRVVTRYGGGEEGLDRSLALWVALMGLPGIPFLYQGDELGLENGVVAPENVLDPLGKSKPAQGRDPGRTHMPWATGPCNGFSVSSSPWLVSEDRPDHETVEVQSDDPASPLARMRGLIAARSATAAVRAGPVNWLESQPGTIAYARDGVTHVANLTDAEVELTVDGGLAVGYATKEGTVCDAGSLQVPARTGVILEAG